MLTVATVSPDGRPPQEVLMKLHTIPTLSVLGLCVVLIAGCPLQSESNPAGSIDTGIGGATFDNDNSGGDTSRPGVSGESSTVTDTVADGLTVEFPGCREPSTTQLWAAEVLRLVNDEREAVGVAPVVWSDQLAEQASQYACEMIYYGFFDHVNPSTGSTLSARASDFDYDYWIIGENLAAGQRSPVEVVWDWMHSPCHRENLLNPAFTELGIGIRYGGDYGYYWVQEFGRPFAEAPYRGEEYHDPECQHEG
jgi:uncharacterized protein YkwD